jgi:hypothetical protein
MPAAAEIGGSMNYSIAWYVAAILFLINIAIAAIQAFYTAGHGDALGLTPQVQAWLAIVSAVIATALGLLPQIQRTPAVREQTYLRALAGMLPHDIAAKYPEEPIPPPASHIPPGAT